MGWADSIVSNRYRDVIYEDTLEHIEFMRDVGCDFCSVVQMIRIHHNGEEFKMLKDEAMKIYGIK